MVCQKASDLELAFFNYSKWGVYSSFLQIRHREVEARYIPEADPLRDSSKGFEVHKSVKDN